MDRDRELPIAVSQLLLVKAELTGLRPQEAKAAEYMLMQKYGLIAPELTAEEKESLYEIFQVCK